MTDPYATYLCGYCCMPNREPSPLCDKHPATNVSIAATKSGRLHASIPDEVPEPARHCPQCRATGFQKHSVHEIADLRFCPQCRHVELHDELGVMEYSKGRFTAYVSEKGAPC